jgi:hypothetical protein
MKSLLYVFLFVILCPALALCQSVSPAAVAFDATPISIEQTTDSPLTNTPWQEILETSLKCPAGQSDLLVTLSAQSLLEARSYNSDNSSTEGVGTGTRENVGIEVRLLIDGKPTPVAPPAIATGVMLNSFYKDTYRVNWRPVEALDILTMVISQGGTNNVTWVVPKVGLGEHTIAIQARFDFENLGTPSGGNINSYSGFFGALGPRTLIVQTVKLKQKPAQN